MKIWKIIRNYKTSFSYQAVQSATYFTAHICEEWKKRSILQTFNWFHYIAILEENGMKFSDHFWNK